MSGSHWANVETRLHTYEHDQKKLSIYTSAMMGSVDGGF